MDLFMDRTLRGAVVVRPRAALQGGRRNPWPEVVQGGLHLIYFIYPITRVQPASSVLSLLPASLSFPRCFTRLYTSPGPAIRVQLLTFRRAIVLIDCNTPQNSPELTTTSCLLYPLDCLLKLKPR
jgi:hypothetical protein